MRNRIANRKSYYNPRDIKQFFLACEFKPNTPMWSVLDPFAYDIKPAFIYGKLGVISYTPNTYAITSIEDTNTPLAGYLITITHPDTILLLDKIKGFNGPEAFNTHIRKLAHVYVTPKKVFNAWCYVLSKYVKDAYQRIEEIEYGFWDNDEKQYKLLEKIGVI